jgi:hypothetical protein
MANSNLAYNSNVEIITIDGVKYIEKTFRLAMPREEAEDIRQRIVLQRHAFQDMHVPTSEMVSIEVVKEGEGHTIKIREIFAGLDFKDVVDDNNFSMYFDRLLMDVFKPLLRSTTDENLRAGIDPALRNFVYNNRTAEFVYVDFIPPKVFYKGTYSQEVPEIPDPEFHKVRMFKHNNRAGVIYGLYVDVVRDYPTQLKYASARIEQFLAEIGEERLSEYIVNSPMHRMHSAAEVKEIIEKITDWHWNNYYLLREIANWLAFKNPELIELQRQVYTVTSQERDPRSVDYGRLSEANFQKAKQLLIEGVGKCE